jgi:hypothetical protein
MIHNVVVPWLLLEAVKRCFGSHCVVLKGMMMMIMMMCCILGFALLRGGASLPATRNEMMGEHTVQLMGCLFLFLAYDDHLISSWSPARFEEAHLKWSPSAKNK